MGKGSTYGGAAGAVGGGAIGSAAGPAGTIGGAMLGHSLGSALGGMFDDDGFAVDPYAYDFRYADEERAAQRRAREQQDALAAELWRRQQGLAPSVAERQLAQTTQQQQAATASIAASARGGAMGQAAAQQEAARQQAYIGQTAAGQAATLRAQEQAQAEGALAQLYGQQRQQDLAAQQGEVTTQLGVGQQRVAEQGVGAQAYAADRQAQTGMFGAFAGAGSSLLGGGLAAKAGGGGQLSDRRAKTDIEPMSDRDLEGLLEALKAYWYRYKGDGGPRHGGVMAQDVGESKLGEALLRRDDEGMLNIDQGDGLSAALASLGNLHERVAKLEGGK